MDPAGDPLAFLDCFSGVAGDMWVGALLDLGLELDRLREPVASLDLPGVHLHAAPVQRAGLAGTHFQVRLDQVPRRHRHLSDILAILDRGRLPDPVRERAAAVFRALAEVEARVHGTTVDAVHFHEVGAEDTIVDVVCTVLGCHLLGFRRIYSSTVTTGTGTVTCEHGTMPVPAPGALANLVGIPVRSGGPAGECVTPTGAALLRVLVDGFEPRLDWIPERIGYGAGSRDHPSHPNLLRITAGRSATASAEDLHEISCNLDTVTGEGLAFLIDGSLEVGAVDAFATAIQMKKGRPGWKFTALVDAGRLAAVAEFLLQESSSLGVRHHRVTRTVVERWQEDVATDLGTVRYKVARLPSGEVLRRPEDDEVRRLVAAHGLGRRAVLARLAATDPGPAAADR